MIRDAERANGGPSGTGGGRRLTLTLATGFVAICLVQLVANVASTAADLTGQNVAIPVSRVWIWEATSIFAWLTATPAIWWSVRRIRPPKFGWAIVAVAVVAGSVVVSLWHVGLMVALRHAIYALIGDRYDFFGSGPWARIFYEYRKDVPTYLIFTSLAALAQWLLRREAAPATAPGEPATLAVADGTIVHRIPLDEIESVIAAGNYVEIAWRDRTMLHRATLAAVAEALGDRFVRIHRARLVRRDAIRRVETDRSGDFTVVTASGATLRGSRRYRAAAIAPPV